MRRRWWVPTRSPIHGPVREGGVILGLNNEYLLEPVNMYELELQTVDNGTDLPKNSYRHLGTKIPKIEPSLDFRFKAQVDLKNELNNCIFCV